MSDVAQHIHCWHDSKWALTANTPSMACCWCGEVRTPLSPLSTEACGHGPYLLTMRSQEREVQRIHDLFSRSREVLGP